MTSQARKPWIAILEGDALVCRSIVRLTWSYGVHCEAFTSAHEFIAVMESGRSSGLSCVILDADLPELDDPRVLEHFNRISPHTPLVLLGSGDKTRLREHALAAAAAAFFEKPIDVERFMATLLAMPAIAPVPLLLAGLRPLAKTTRPPCRGR